MDPERGKSGRTNLGVEGGAHDVVVVARQYRDAGARLPVPDADGLVVRRGDDPGVPDRSIGVIGVDAISPKHRWGPSYKFEAAIESNDRLSPFSGPEKGG